MLLVAGCVSPEPEAGRAEPVRSTVRLQSPVKVRWEERSRTAAGAVLVAHVERVTAVPLPLLLRLEVPAGVKVLAGRARLELPANAEASDAAETFELAWAVTPAADARLRVDGESAGLGFHFDVPYRFGRAEPEPRPPAATGPSAGKGGRQFGPSIPVK